MADSDDNKPLELPLVTGARLKRQQTSENPRKSKDTVTATTTINTPRDPRFDPRCSGSNDPRHFIRNYSFLDDVRQKELNELQQSLKREKDHERKEKIKMTISRYRNKINDYQEKREHTNKRKTTRDKKSQIVERYKALKQSGKLSRYLERKRKKLIKKDERSFR